MSLMLCETILPEKVSALAPDDWVIEPKYDGVRAIINDGRIFDRRGKDITARFPEFHSLILGKGVCLDGEIINPNGDFGDVSARMHLKDKLQIRVLSITKPCLFVVFDCPDISGSLIERRKHLESCSFPEWIKLIEQYPLKVFDGLWNEVISRGDEGIIIKYKYSVYEQRRSSMWLKCKAFKEISAEFVKYEEHPKGITMETIDGRRVVVNGKQADEVRERFKKTGRITADIQYLPQLSSSAWRFPSFRSIHKENREKR